MHNQELTLEEALKIGHEAKDYARSKIKKGSTQLENNNLSETYFDHLLQGVSDVRTFKQTTDARSRSHDPLEFNDIVIRYENSIAMTSKYSLGNCEELGFHALDYILNQVPAMVHAEIYFVRGGDHVVLVINRGHNSNPQNPNTWGDNSVICDPWSNKVFKASDYLTKLKTFERDWGDYKITNYVHDFDPTIHLLLPDQRFDSNYLRHHRTVANLKANFIREIDHIILVINNYKESLIMEIEVIRNKHGDQDQRIKIISEKISMIERVIQITKDDTIIHLNATKTNDYRLAKKQLLKSLYAITKSATRVMEFSRGDIDVLIEHKGKDIKTDVMKFFGMKSTTHAHLKKITEEANNALRMKPYRK